MSYIEKITDSIYDIIDIGIKNLKLAGYHITSYGISIENVKFWVEIEGDCVDELEKVNASSFIKISTAVVESNIPGDRNTSIDCTLTAIDAFIIFTKALLVAERLEQKHLVFGSIVKSIASKIRISVDIKDNIDRSIIYINIITPTKYFTSVDTRLQLNDIGIHPATSISYNDHIKYSLELENDDYAKFRFIDWLSSLPMNNDNFVESTEYDPFWDIIEDVLESKHCDVKSADEKGNSGLYKIEFYCPCKINFVLLTSYPNQLYDVYTSNIASDEYESAAMYYASISFGIKDIEASKRAIHDFVNSFPDADA